MFHLLMKHCVECLIYYEQKNKMILAGEIKDEEMSSFLSDF